MQVATTTNKASIQELLKSNRPLAIYSAFTALMIVFFAVGIIADSRMVTGVPVWLKPFKFAISISIYCFTMLFFLSIIDTSKNWKARLVKILNWTIMGTFAAEWLAVITQAARGTPSHFNYTTPFDAFMWGIMGFAILILWIANFIVAGLLLGQKFDNKTFAWSLRLGLIITIIGMGLGYLMTSPTAQQLASWQAGEAFTVAGAHTVGLEDGGPGLPLLNWSTEGGDLRVGHFVGMHALQVIPFLGWALSRRRRKTNAQQEDQKKDTQLIFTASFAYLAIVLLLTWQALRGQSIIAPDLLTVATFIGICTATAASVLLIVRPKNQELSRLSVQK